MHLKAHQAPTFAVGVSGCGKTAENCWFSAIARKGKQSLKCAEGL